VYGLLSSSDESSQLLYVLDLALPLLVLVFMLVVEVLFLPGLSSSLTRGIRGTLAVVPEILDILVVTLSPVELLELVFVLQVRKAGGVLSFSSLRPLGI